MDDTFFLSIAFLSMLSTRNLIARFSFGLGRIQVFFGNFYFPVYIIII